MNIVLGLLVGSQPKHQLSDADLLEMKTNELKMLTEQPNRLSLKNEKIEK